MTNPLRVDLFVEDRAHEEFLKPILTRIAAEASVAVDPRVRSARGGHGRAIQEYSLYQTLVSRAAGGATFPDLVIVAIDGNCSTVAKKREEIFRTTLPVLRPRVVVACPDPHVERWYLADPPSFATTVGHQPVVGRKKCARDHYKRLLTEAVRKANHVPTLGGVEFAADIVGAMDFYRASKNDKSLGAFLGDLRAQVKKAAASGSA